MASKGSDFLTGFMQGFNQAGGMQRVSNWAAKKSGSYDVFQDPYAMQAYSQARQIGTPAAQQEFVDKYGQYVDTCLLYTSPSPRDRTRSRMPSSA